MTTDAETEIKIYGSEGEPDAEVEFKRWFAEYGPEILEKYRPDPSEEPPVDAFVAVKWFIQGERDQDDPWRFNMRKLRLRIIGVHLDEAPTELVPDEIINAGLGGETFEYECLQDTYYCLNPEELSDGPSDDFWSDVSDYIYRYLVENGPDDYIDEAVQEAVYVKHADEFEELYDAMVEAEQYR